jgi:hypothetical protein
VSVTWQAEKAKAEDMPPSRVAAKSAAAALVFESLT